MHHCPSLPECTASGTPRLPHSGMRYIRETSKSSSSIDLSYSRTRRPSPRNARLRAARRCAWPPRANSARPVMISDGQCPSLSSTVQGKQGDMELKSSSQAYCSIPECHIWCFESFNLETFLNVPNIGNRRPKYPVAFRNAYFAFTFLKCTKALSEIVKKRWRS